MTIRRMRIACCVCKSTDTHSQYVILLFFHGSNGYANALKCYVTRTMRVFLVPNYKLSFSRQCHGGIQGVQKYIFSHP